MAALLEGSSPAIIVRSMLRSTRNPAATIGNDALIVVMPAS